MARPRAANDPSVRTQLSERQREVLALVAKGHTNAGIAERLGITLDGVKWHVSEILARLDVDSREEAAELWRRSSGVSGLLGRLRAGTPPAGLVAKVAAIGLTAGATAFGAVLVFGALRGEEDGQSDPTLSVAAESSATPEPTPTLPTGSARPCIPGDLLMSWETTAVGDDAVIELRITKPRTCDLIERTETFVVAPGETAQGKRLATLPGVLVAMAGTDRAFVTIRWRNWCNPVPTPGPTFDPRNQSPPHDDVPLWYFHDLDTQSGTGAGAVYPPCRNPGTPPSIEVTVRTEPDPPAALVTSPGAPAVSIPAEAEAFARWFVGVVSGRDSAAVAGIAQSFDIACGANATPPCAGVAAGERRAGYFMDSSGSLGSAGPFQSQLTRTMAASGPLRAIGCADASPNCQHFVLAFEAIPGNGPGSYQAYVFEVQSGAAILRGIYPGGGDVATVFGGGAARGPWGPTTWSPIAP